ncbi:MULTISPECIES: hypothetical protein [Actinomyces]|uniref:Uncharacterized protein n=1 Tax=Actinomyces respiraculi TaxID=2744574 RepID=A0A7T0PWR0_9ACTO|nr:MULTISPECIES: hypothetical protein [Actinomyces]QPL04825.1 hypothetical protein ID810_08660 [Actinomyces respiraculi]
MDEQVWHHVRELSLERGGPGPQHLAGMVDLTPGADGVVRDRWLGLVPGGSGKASSWLAGRGQDFRSGVKVAALEAFQGCKNAIDD